MNKKIFLLSIALLIAAIGFSQKSTFNPQMGISLKGSTNGIGGDLYFRATKMFAIKAGAEYAKANITAATLEPYVGDALSVAIPMPTGNDMVFDAGANFKTGALSAAIGFQPFGGLYLTAGIAKFLFATEVTGTPMTDLELGSHTVPLRGTVEAKIHKEDIGIFSIKLDPTKTITPYFGIGLGSFVPRKGAVSFALEFGAYYVGAWALKASLPAGFKSENIDYISNPPMTNAEKNLYFGSANNDVDQAFSDLQTQVDNAVADLNKTIEPFGFYPVIKLTIGIRALTFKK